MHDNWFNIIKSLVASISPYYAVSLAVSLVAVLFTIWYTRSYNKETLLTGGENMDCFEKDEELHNSDSCSEGEVDFSEDEYDEDGNIKSSELKSLEDLQARYKTAKHQAIVDHLSAKMTPEEIVEEKQTEKAQLEAIFSLLKDQQEKFNVCDMKDVEQQLSLYR